VANRKPIVHIPSNATPLQRLPSGDTIDAADVENAVTSASNLVFDNLVTAAGNDRTIQNSGIAAADVVTAGSNFGASDQLIVSAGTSKGVQSVSITSANLVTAASAFGTDDVLLASGGTGRGAKATAIDKDNVVTAASAFGAAQRILVAGGNDKTVVGSSASIETAGSFFRLLLTQTATDPVLIGNLAGRNATFGQAPVVIGQDAGGDTTGSLTTTLGNRVVCLGRGAGSAGGVANSVVNDDCVLVAQFCGARGTIGAGTIGIGTFAFFGGTVGAGCVGIGNSAFSSVTVGLGNVGIGINAGRGVNSASAENNTFIGAGAGGTGIGQLSSATQSVAVGYLAFTEASNQVALGGSSTTICTMRSSTELRKGTTALSFDVYETYTSATNFERFRIHFSSNVCRLETQDGAGGGTASALALGTDSNARLTFNADGTIVLNTVGNLPTTEPASGNPGTLWLQNDGGSSNSAFLMVTTS